MSRRLVIAVAAAVATAIAVPAGAAGRQLEIGEINTSQAPRLTATITARGLPKGAKPVFSVFVNGKKASDVNITPASNAASIAILTDSSRSMSRGGGLRAAKKAVAGFSRDRDQNTRVAIYEFGKTSASLLKLTDDSIAIDDAIGRIALDAQEGTALYDAIVAASGELAGSTDATRRIVVLTDGTDQGSSATLDEAIKAAREAGAPIEAIALGDAGGGVALKNLAAKTGGHFYQASSSSVVIGQTYSQIASDLRSSYQLSYTSPSNGAVNLQVRLPGYAPATATATIEGVSAAAAGSTSIMHEIFGNSLLTGLLIGFIVLAICWVLMREPREAKMNKLIDKYITPTKTIAQQTKGKRDDRTSLRSLLIHRSERSFGRSNYFKRVAEHLERADMPLRAAELVAMQAGGLIAGLFIGGVVLGAFIPALLAAPLFAIIGTYVPLFYVKRKAKKRRKRFENQLGEALAAIAGSLRAGQSFQQSISSLVKDGPDPLAKEFARVETEIQLGRPSDEALDAMAKRVASKNFDFVVIAVNIQRQVGGSLSDILDMVSDTVSARVQFARKVKALTAQGRASGYVLLGMPFVMGGLITLIKHDYMTPLFTTMPGNIMIVVGLVLMGIGWMAVNKIVNFKY